MSKENFECGNTKKGNCFSSFINSCFKKPCCCVCPPGPMGPEGPEGPMGPPGPHRPFLSSYAEVLGNGQTIAKDGDIVFDTYSIDSVGDNIVLESDGTTFTINHTGLYYIDWNVNLASESVPAVIGILENGEPASGSASSVAGNFSSGTVINVNTVPFTISLHNYNDEITIEHPDQWEGSAASIRIIRFAEGAS